MGTLFTRLRRQGRNRIQPSLKNLQSNVISIRQASVNTSLKLEDQQQISSGQATVSDIPKLEDQQQISITMSLADNNALASKFNDYDACQVYNRPETPSNKGLSENKEYMAMITVHDKLVTSLSTDLLSIANILLPNRFISEEVYSQVLLHSLTPHEKASILVRAIRDKIKVAPSQFQELIKTFMEQASTKVIAQILLSTYEGNV